MHPKIESVESGSRAIEGSLLRIPVTALRPFARCNVESPSLIGCRQMQHIKAVSLVLVGVSVTIGDRGIALQRVLDAMIRDSLRSEAICAIDDATAALVGSEPEDRVIQAHDRILSGEPVFDEGAVDDVEREGEVASV